MSSLNGRGLGGIPINAEIFAVDAKNGQLKWIFDGGGGLTGPIIGSNKKLYFASTVNPYFYCIETEGDENSQTTRLVWKVHMDNKVEESVPCLYNNKAFILNSGGYLVAIE